MYDQKLHCNPQDVKHIKAKTQKGNVEFKMIEKTL